MKTYENFITKILKKDDDVLEPETQEEIDKQLAIAVKNNLWWEFLDAIKKGANPNQPPDSEYTLLMHAINTRDFRMVDELVKHGADVYYQIRRKFDLYNWAMKMSTDKDRLKIKKIFLRYHTDFFENRELMKTANKYNL